MPGSAPPPKPDKDLVRELREYLRKDFAEDDPRWTQDFVADNAVKAGKKLRPGEVSRIESGENKFTSQPKRKAVAAGFHLEHLQFEAYMTGRASLEATAALVHADAADDIVEAIVALRFSASRYRELSITLAYWKKRWSPDTLALAYGGHFENDGCARWLASDWEKRLDYLERLLRDAELARRDEVTAKMPAQPRRELPDPDSLDEPDP